MKSLFLRLLVSMWIIMTILGGIFAVIHAWTFPQDATQRWRRVSSRTTELRAMQALDCRQTAGAEPCDEVLEPLDDRDPRLAIYQDGVRIVGSDIEGAADVEAIARTTQSQSTKTADGRTVAALYLRRAPNAPTVVVSIERTPSRWMFFIGPDTLPIRLGAIVVVTGLVSLALARWISRPLRTLRAATQRFATGDLSARVEAELTGADAETAALGHEMDRMAERISALLEAQRRLLRDVSHELRSPLARLNIALELARRKAAPEAKDALDRIEREADRLDAMIGQLLALSRLEAGDGLETAHPVDIRSLVESVIAEVAIEAEERASKIELQAPEVPVTIDGNDELLQRAIENVLRNAIRYTKEGTPIEVDLASLEPGSFDLTIRDHGPGVPEDSLEKIFKPFFRIGDDRARKSGGAGIGLAIAERAIALHGGAVGAKNAEGGGLAVTFSLRRAANEARTSRPRSDVS